MRSARMTLILLAAMAVVGSVSLPSVAIAQHHGHHGYGHYYSPYYGYGYGHGFGYGGYGGYGLGRYGGYGYGGYRSNLGTVRIEVNPKAFRDEAGVYVNGHHVGMVDDFDGTFQRLYLDPGEYEVEVRLDGYRSFRRKILVSPGNTYKIRHQMERLLAGEVESTGSESAGRAATESDPSDYQDSNDGSYASGSGYGTVRLQVKPREDNAQVFVDGAHAGVVDDFDGIFQRLYLATGEHEIEVRLDGHRTFKQQVLVGPGSNYDIRHRMEPAVN